MLAFDPAELRNAGVDLVSLPDETGYVIEAKVLPNEFAEQLERSGLDMTKPIRVCGRIARRADGRAAYYLIHFEQA